MQNELENNFDSSAIETIATETSSSLPQEIVMDMDNDQLLQKICQQDFLSFCMAMMPEFIASSLHTLLCDVLQGYYEDVKADKDVRAMFELPPQTGKSTLVSILFPAWVLGKEAWPVICASYGSSLAERNSGFCRDVINNPLYERIFPGVKLNPDSTAKDYWRTTKGGSYKAIGVGGGLTGFSGKIMVCDDPFKDRADADSEVIRETTWGWFQSTFLTRKQSRTAILIPNTRWHMDDVSGKLIEQEDNNVKAGVDPAHFDHWDRWRFPAIAEEDEYFNGKLFRSVGEVLVPERFTLEDMIKTRNNVSVYEWSSLYQQSPILAENQLFKVDYFKFFEENDLDVDGLRSRLTYYTMVDLAISAKKDADNTSIITIGKASDDENVYVIDEHTGHFDPSEIIEYLFYLRNRFGMALSVVGIESVGYQASLAHFVNTKQKQTGQYFNVVDLKATERNKMERIKSLEPRFKNGTILFRPTMVDLQREFLQFPKGKRDDRADALSYMDQLLPVGTIERIARQFIPSLRRY